MIGVTVKEKGANQFFFYAPNGCLIGALYASIPWMARALVEDFRSIEGLEAALEDAEEQARRAEEEAESSERSANVWAENCETVDKLLKEARAKIAELETRLSEKGAMQH